MNKRKTSFIRVHLCLCGLSFNLEEKKTINCDVQVYQFYEESGHKMRFSSVLLSINHRLGNTRCKINSCVRIFFFLTFFLFGKIDVILEN